MPARLRHPESLPWREFYGLQIWKIRRRHQLQVEPLCRSCLAEDVVTPATVADHIVPHKGDWNSFRLGALQSLCKRCHDAKGSPGWRGYDDTVGADGLRVDPRHPLNLVGKSAAKPLQ